MISKFTVSNFKSFNKEFCFDLENTNGYNFNKESIQNGVVNNALIYGHNGVGKSNLGFAIFDIIGHLLDDESVNKSQYSIYTNALNNSNLASFKYEFVFDSSVVIYEYQKEDYKTIIMERFTVDGKELASIDKSISDEAFINIKGAESLKKNIANKNLSLLKYIRNNSVLESNTDTLSFNKFFNFIEGMLFFRTLQANTYFGLENVSGKDIMEDIIDRGNVSDLELFLNNAGVKCKLAVVKESDKNVLAFDFNGNTISFFDISSTGSNALILFYFWLQRLRNKSKVSFLFIDEFDAFYHHELSALIVKELKKTGVQFVLTTHNTSIITNDLLRPDCYFLMNKQSINSLAKCTSKELREAHNIEKMYKAGSFNVK